MATFERYTLWYREQAAVKSEMQDIAADPAKVGNVFLYGSVGTGKDHLLAAALYAAAAAGLSASWVNGQEIYSRFRDIMDSGGSEERLLAEYVRPQVLGISDPIPPIVDPKKPKEWRTELLYRVIDGRYGDLKPTWITCNADSTADAEEKLSKAVFDRLRDGAVVLPCFWPSARREKR